MNIFELEKIVREKCEIPNHHALYLSYDGKGVTFYHGSGENNKLYFGSLDSVPPREVD